MTETQTGVVECKWYSPLVSLVKLAITTVVLMAFIAGYGRYHFGSLSRALAYASGDRVLVDERQKALLGMLAGSKSVVQYSITNLTGRDLKILGADTSCTCTSIENLPLTVARGMSKELTVSISAPRQPGPTSASIILFTDYDSQPTVPLEFVGTVVGSQAAAPDLQSNH
jgi:Protein of unknown function (DUF1573)